MDATHLGLVLCQLFTVLITSLSASLLQSSLFVFYIAAQGPIAHPREYFFHLFFLRAKSGAEKPSELAQWTPQLWPGCDAWRHKLIRHMPDRSHLMPHALLPPADCLLSAPSVILRLLSFAGLHVPVTSERIILRSICRQTGWKHLKK